MDETTKPAPEPPPREPDDTARGRPGRRTVGERKQAVLELLGGKATVDQLARRYGVRAETIEGWRADALDGIADALRRGDGRSARELELERENANLKDALATQTMKAEILERAAKLRPHPTRPGRSR